MTSQAPSYHGYRFPPEYLWWAVDEDGDVIDILVQSRRNRRAAMGFFRKSLKGEGREPRLLITDKLRSYAVSIRSSDLLFILQ